MSSLVIQATTTSRLARVLIKETPMLQTPLFPGARFTRALPRSSSLTVVVVALVFPCALLAQTGIITGKVTDAETKLPIADVRVAIARAAIAAPTNAQGEFRLANVRAG